MRNPENTSQRESRRRAIKWIAGAAVTGTVLTVALQAGIFEPIFGKRQEEELSGEINQTKELLSKWTQELERNPQNREGYLIKTRDLAIAYFSEQIGYERERLQGRVELLEGKEYFEKLTNPRCGQEVEDFSGFVHVLEDKAFINKDDRNIAQGIESLSFAFITIIHELLHLAPPKKHHAEPISILRIPKLIAYEKGLGAFSLPEPSSQCPTAFRRSLEEAVVEDATLRMILPLGFDFQYIIGYPQFVRAYRQEVLKLYGGDHRELLGYQQRSDAEGFFRSIGEKIGGPGVKDPFILGNDYLIRVFQEAR